MMIAATRALKIGFCASSLMATKTAVSPAKSNASVTRPHAVLTSPFSTATTMVLAFAVPCFMST